MKIHEYQAKQILSRFGVSIPRGEVAVTPEEARAVAERLGGTVSGFGFIIELTFLPGRAKLAGYEVESLIRY